MPYTERVALARALAPGRARLFLLEGLHHVDREIRGLDAWRMWRAVQAVLAQRDRDRVGIGTAWGWLRPVPVAPWETGLTDAVMARPGERSGLSRHRQENAA